MSALDKLQSAIRDRGAELRKSKEEGRKVIGYTQGDYLPMEIIYACEPLPVSFGLIRGGEHEPVTVSGAYVPRWIDTFCRAQIGYWALKEEPFYQMLDLLIVPITDSNVRAIADLWDFYTPVEVFRYGVPHGKTNNGYRYFLDGLRLLKEKLEAYIGTKITDDKLKEAIQLCNQERRLFRNLSFMRQGDELPFTSREFVMLNHGSFLIDKKVMVEILKEFTSEVKERKLGSIKSPRILLTGSTLAMGDLKILDFIGESGATVVVEEFAEGLRYYWDDLENAGDPLEALADFYFKQRIHGAWLRPGRERLDFLLKLVKTYHVDGVIWYQTMYRDSYDIEAFYFSELLKKETGLQMLKLESDYEATERGPFLTRIETFIETIKRGR